MSPAPRIWKAVGLVWRDIWQVLRALTALTIAFVIILAVGLAPLFIPVKPDWAAVSKVFLPAAVAAVQAFLLTPYLIASSAR